MPLRQRMVCLQPPFVAAATKLHTLHLEAGLHFVATARKKFDVLHLLPGNTSCVWAHEAARMCAPQ